MRIATSRHPVYPARCPSTGDHSQRIIIPRALERPSGVHVPWQGTPADAWSCRIAFHTHTLGADSIRPCIVRHQMASRSCDTLRQDIRYSVSMPRDMACLGPAVDAPPPFASRVNLNHFDSHKARLSPPKSGAVVPFSPSQTSPPDPLIPSVASACHTPNAERAWWGKPRARAPVPPPPTSALESASGPYACPATIRNVDKAFAC